MLQALERPGIFFAVETSSKTSISLRVIKIAINALSNFFAIIFLNVALLRNFLVLFVH
jgi:hypothetical protein